MSDMFTDEELGEFETELLGAGVDTANTASLLINAAAELAKAGATTYSQSQAADLTAKQLAEATSKALAADSALASAFVQVELARASKDSQKIEAATALASATGTALDAATRGMPQAVTDKRIAAAQAAVQAAAQESIAAPKDGAKAARLRAWQQVATRIQQGGLPPAGQMPSSLQAFDGAHADGGPSFFTKKHWGLPTYAWMGIGSVTLVGGGLALRAWLRRR